MKRYPLEALRRVNEERVGRALASVAARLQESGAAEEELRREEACLAALERQIASEDLPSAVAELRALAGMAAHRTLLHGRRTRAREAVESAHERAEQSRALLEHARAEQRCAVRAREAVKLHRSGWRRASMAALEAAEERAADEAWSAVAGRKGA